MRDMLLCSRGGCTYEVAAGGKRNPGDKCPQCGRGELCRWHEENPIYESPEVATFFRTAEVRR